MAKSLVIVESPAKSKTIGKFLGPDFEIKASMGHVIDLPKSQLGIDIEHDFAPQYTVIRGKDKILKELAAAAKKADVVYLALDPDREGEAIAWHLANYIQEKFKGTMHRVTFNEITKKAITEAVQHPGKVNIDLVNAQQARRALDRIVGYKVSPFLWKGVGRGLSAGRVQSVCVRLICEREEEIKAFVAQESWTIEGLFHRHKEKRTFTAILEKMGEDKVDVRTEAQANDIVKALDGVTYKVDDIAVKEKKRFPDAPLITSTMQQRAAYKLRFSASRTMTVAQQLYEGIDLGKEETVGLITYMRTDSYRIAKEAQEEARAYVAERFGKDYVPAQAPVYGKKKSKNQKVDNTQDAHEAIRPTYVRRDPESVKPYLSSDQYKLYRLIWMQFIKSQMAPAIFDATVVRLRAGDGLFKANGSVVKFPGYLAAEQDVLTDTETEDAGAMLEDWDEAVLPPLQLGEEVVLQKLDAIQHFTKPPARYSEATLVKALEEYGIGRPSTYAPTIKTIQDRGYVEKIEQRFHPTKLGVRVNDVLVQFMPHLFNVDFTAHMEEDLDQVAEGQKDWVQLLREFYAPLQQTLSQAEDKMSELKQQVVETDEICDKCKSPMILKMGRYGQFMACSNYPACKNTRDPQQGEADKELAANAPTCDLCSKPMNLKLGRFGKFWACSGYPDCKGTKAIVVASGVKCPTEGCEGELVQRKSHRRGKLFWGCSRYPACTYLNQKLPENTSAQ